MLLCPPVSAASDPPSVSAAAAILVHPASGAVLYAVSADEPMRIASITKLMTALIAAERLDPELEIEILPGWTAVEGSSMYLKAGESYTVRELLEGLLLASGNDAALALAGAAAGDTDGFVLLMNEKCRELGLTDTCFENPHGLDSPGHHSTARDLAVVMTAVLSDPMLRRIMGMSSCAVHGLVYENHNKLLRTCPGVFAGKTGYTKAAGRCLVSSCERDGMELICVTLSDPDDWRDHSALYDWAFGAYKEVIVPAGKPLCDCSVVSGTAQSVSLVSEMEIRLCVSREAEICIRFETAPFIMAPAEPGESAGRVRLTVGGETAAEARLLLSGFVSGNTA